MSSKNLRCYNCGIPLTKETKTRDHIPAQNTFVGYSPEYKKNRITVPACDPCNNEYSKIDQEIRDAIGVIEDNEEQKELVRKSVKSIIMKGNLENRIELHPDGQTIYVYSKYEDFKKISIKDFKGVFYHNYGFPLPTNYDITALFDEDKADEQLFDIIERIYNFTKEDNWCVSGHENVFQYKIKAGIHDENNKIVDTTQIDNALVFAAVITYRKKITAVVFAIRKDL